MILTLFGVLVLIALILITIGLINTTESAQALIGFALLFFLATVILQGNLEFEVGAMTNTTYSYDAENLINFTQQDITYQYETFDDGTSRQMGFYLAIASVVGFVGVLASLKKPNKEYS